MKRIEALTSLRFVFAIMVLTYHFGTGFTGEVGELAGNFSPGRMSFFYTLSGFVLMLAYFDRQDLSSYKFYLARGARILPLYFLALIVTVPFRYGEGINNLTGLILSVTLLQAWVHPYELAFNGPAWTLSVEVFFYAIFPLLVYQIRKRNISPGNLFFVAISVYLVTQIGLIYLINAPFFERFPSWTFNIAYFSPPAHFCSFFLGIAGGLIYLRNQNRTITEGFRSYSLLFFALALDLLAVFLADRIAESLGIHLPTRSSFHSLTRLGLILAIAFTHNRITQAMSWKPLVVLGQSSYALYIFQRPLSLMILSIQQWLQILVTPSIEGFFILASIIVCIAVLLHLYVEPAGKKFVYNLDGWIRNSSVQPDRV